MYEQIVRLRVYTPGITERLWAMITEPGQAKILNVVRHGGPAQFGDVVKYEGEEIVAVLTKSGSTMHEISGGMTTPGAAWALTKTLNDRGLHIEVWSHTMAGERPVSAPLKAGLMVADPQRALVVLGSIGLQLYYPTLLAAVGDELGARRHLRDAHRAA